MLVCAHCGLPYDPDDIDLSLGVAHCKACDTVSELSSRARPQDTPAYPMPASCRWVVHDGPNLHLELPWRSWELAFLLFFSVFWNGGILVMLMSIALEQGLMAALPMLAIPHVWVGIGLGYYVIASFVNTTVVAVDDGKLIVDHGPLPWWGQRAIPLEDVDQLYVERSGVRVNKQPRWNLCVMSPSGTGQVLVRLLRTESEGRWLEDHIEKRLAIVDKPIAGEVAKL